MIVDNEQKKERVEKAVELYKKITTLHPEHYGAYMEWGKLLEEVRSSEAEGKYLAVLQFMPNNHAALLALSKFYFKEGETLKKSSTTKDYERGIEMLKKCEETLEKLVNVAVEDLESIVEAYFLYGQICVIFGQEKELASEKKPSQSQVLQRYTKAAKFFTAAIESLPSISEKLFSLYPLSTPKLAQLCAIIAHGCGVAVKKTKEKLEKIEEISCAETDLISEETERTFVKLLTVCRSVKKLNLTRVRLEISAIPFLLEILSNNSSTLEELSFPLLQIAAGGNWEKSLSAIPSLQNLKKLSLQSLSLDNNSLTFIKDAHNIMSLDVF